MQSNLNPNVFLIFITVAILLHLPHALSTCSFIEQSDSIRLFFKTALSATAAYSSPLPNRPKQLFWYSSSGKPIQADTISRTLGAGVVGGAVVVLVLGRSKFGRE